MNRATLVFLLAIAGALALTVYLAFDYAAYQRDRDERSIELGREAGTRVADALDAQLSAVSARASSFSAAIGAVTDEATLLRLIQEESLAVPLLLGVTVAYEPGRFAGRARYAPFFNKSRDEFQFVEESYDYTSPDLATARWYTEVIATGMPSWSDPYFAEAAQEMVVDYGVPLRNPQGDLIGMVDYTITLSDFTRIVDSLAVGESGYGFTFEPGGAIISHPDPDYLLENVYQIRDGKDETIIATLRTEPEGVVRYQSTYTYRYSWFFFRALESTGWKSVLVFAEDDLLGASDQGRRKQIHLALGIGALLTALLAFALRVDHYDPHRLWWLVCTVSIVIVGNIIAVWYLNLTTDFSRLENDQERIVNGTIRSRYVKAYDDELYRLTQSHYRQVPTGVFIESIELTSFEASVIGRLWMKYPKTLYDAAPPAFYLPDVSSLEARGLASELISEVDAGDHMLVTWRFRALLEQHFSYRQFPFEQNDIRLTFLYPDLDRNVLLVPDLESYEVLNPSARPGTNPSMTVPSSEIISSYFTIDELDYHTNFGSSTPLDSHPALSFNLVAKRIYVNPLISNIVPILIVALIMFIVLFVSSKTHDDRSGMTIMNVIQSAAGLLFILVLAHVNERNRIQTPEIAYIELFYFSMYVLITLQSCLLAALFRGAEWRIFSFQDNLVLKLLFWPVLLSTWYGLTLLRFY
ncbi:MAG: cache domain-containing protein [Pseudomonadales bacterium]